MRNFRVFVPNDFFENVTRSVTLVLQTELKGTHVMQRRTRRWPSPYSNPLTRNDFVLEHSNFQFLYFQIIFLPFLFRRYNVRLHKNLKKNQLKIKNLIIFGSLLITCWARMAGKLERQRGRSIEERLRKKLGRWLKEGIDWKEIIGVVWGFDKFDNNKRIW